jgi:hypothetical protein
MPEMLAIPAWDAEPTTLETWTATLIAHGAQATITHEDEETWLEAPNVGLKGFVSFEGANVEAINFEIGDDAGQTLLHAAAAALNWELHEDEPEEDDIDED